MYVEYLQSCQHSQTSRTSHNITNFRQFKYGYSQSNKYFLHISFHVFVSYSVNCCFLFTFGLIYIFCRMKTSRSVRIWSLFISQMTRVSETQITNTTSLEHNKIMSLVRHICSKFSFLQDLEFYMQQKIICGLYEG
jgi:hypothetical protein